MNYKFNDDTLIHAIGFNPMKLEGILKHGIITENYAKENNINYSRNYNFNLNEEMLKKVENNSEVNEIIEKANKENIYLVRSLYISDDPLSAYNMYVKNGISFIVEDKPFFYNKNKELIKRSDEVIVKNHIEKENIKAIMIPEEYKNKRLNEVNMLPNNILNFGLIKSSVINMIKYLNDYNYDVDIDEIAYLLKDLEIAFKSVKSLDKNNQDYNVAMLDYKDIINDINNLLSNYVYDMFSKLLGRDATVLDMVEYINNKYDNKDIVYLESKGRKRWSKKNYLKYHIYLDVT